VATASHNKTALEEVLERLLSATSQLDALGDPDAVAQDAAAIALRLTLSTRAELSIGDRIFRTAEENSKTPRATASADLRTGGRVLGRLVVARVDNYTDAERQALAIFAGQAANAIDTAIRLRSTDRVERANELAVEVLLAVSSHAVAGQSLSDFYSRLARTVGELVGARRVLFWRLGDDGMLAPIPAGGFGVDRAFVARLVPTQCIPDGNDVASRVVFGDLIFRASTTDTDNENGYVLERLGVASAISVPWRAGEERLGLVAAYDSVRPDGFSREDTSVLQKAGLAAGLVTRLWHTQDDLRKSVERLTKVDGARQLLLKNMTSVVEKERQRFVTELHDDALQKLTAAEIQLGRLRPQDSIDPHALETLQDLLEQTETALRRLVFDVRPPALESPNGLAQSIRDRLAMLEPSGVEHELVFELAGELTPDDRSMIFREVVEAVGNVERHARAKHVKVSLTDADGGVLGVVQDDGEGFVVAERSNLPGHLGLLALRERALMAGGRYTIESQPGAGTRIEFWIPLQRDITV
jgi:signal transduction histidine kinase